MIQYMFESNKYNRINFGFHLKNPGKNSDDNNTISATMF